MISLSIVTDCIHACINFTAICMKIMAKINVEKIIKEHFYKTCVNDPWQACHTQLDQ